MILRFEEDFPGAKIFKLEENYRCTQTILDAANELVVNNPNRARPRSSSRTRAKARTITVFQAESERDEARYVIEKIKEHVRDGSAYRDFVVLYRTNAQSRDLRRSASSPKAFPTASSAASASTRAPRSKTCSRTCATS